MCLKKNPDGKYFDLIIDNLLILKFVLERKLIFIYFCFFQTDGSVPNTLVIANCEVVKPRVAAAEHISQVTRYCVIDFVNFCWQIVALNYW